MAARKLFTGSKSEGLTRIVPWPSEDPSDARYAIALASGLHGRMRKEGTGFFKNCVLKFYR